LVIFFSPQNNFQQPTDAPQILIFSHLLWREKKSWVLRLQSVVNSRERAFKPSKTVIRVSRFNKDWAGIDSIFYVCLAMNMTNVL
jgi:hypothetical protein